MGWSEVRKRLSNELGITTLLNSKKDVYILLFARLVRMVAYGSSTLILALYFAALGHSDTKIGLFMTLTLIGDVLISLLLTLVADTLGRRRILLLGAALMTFSGCIFATSSSYYILLFAAIVGVISPAGNEIGPFRAVEESTLAQLTEASTRSDVFAHYVVAGTSGAAIGSLTAGWATHALQSSGWAEQASYRVVFWLYAIIGLLKCSLTLLLSQECELPPQLTRQRQDSARGAGGNQEDEQRAFLGEHEQADEEQEAPKKLASWLQLSQKSQVNLAKLCGLFFFDSLASGMVPASLIAYFLAQKFEVSEGVLGTIMASAQFVSSLGNIFASSVSKRIGLVRTMVFTHLPSAIFLALLPAPTSLFLTIVLLVARSSLSSMDQAPRSAFLSAVVLPEERTAVMGIVNTVKTMSQSSGPLITGTLSSSKHFWLAFVLAGTLKAAYDLAMLHMFAAEPLGDRTTRPRDTMQDRETDILGDPLNEDQGRRVRDVIVP
ncbi:Putative major facilitator superfamily, MFS transporter superfamily [Septoria linicola]|uniref:Major facilitator superfamily, MFS transporter superfamily n=1 Tax=Septoria linicola TaxID=215465 RepID=A0A9Q9APP8_9PEZI|nr:putative major facilitator superfamily, MFS transporter superfamily [Septoria linicola]USW53179.1 Putative major facilitator superfamily, MFS transporter superfamily [Septoria linicola]